MACLRGNPHLEASGRKSQASDVEVALPFSWTSTQHAKCLFISQLMQSFPLFSN